MRLSSVAAGTRERTKGEHSGDSPGSHKGPQELPGLIPAPSHSGLSSTVGGNWAKDGEMGLALRPWLLGGRKEVEGLGMRVMGEPSSLETEAAVPCVLSAPGDPAAQKEETVARSAEF